MATSPASSSVVFTAPADVAGESYLDATFSQASIFGAAGTKLNAWCIDALASLNTNYSYTGYAYSAYELSALNANLPSNNYAGLDSVNWLINYYNAGNLPGVTPDTIQTAIWQLMGNMGGRSTLTDLALSHDGYVPDAGETLVVVMDSVASGGTHAQTTIVETKAAKLGDRVWSDNNVNGLQDAGEAGIAGATVQLVRDANSDGRIGADEVLVSTSTDAAGNYSFKGLTPGLNYQVRFFVPVGYDAATTRQVDLNAASGNNSDGLLSDVIVLKPGENNATIDSGFYKNANPGANAIIGDRVWTDTNGNGIQDAGEPGKAGVTVQLYNSVNGGPGALVGTQVTDVNGNYKFTSLPPGDYILMFVSKDGSVLTTADVGTNDMIDSDANTKGLTGTYTLGAGENNTSVDAGFKPLINARIGDRVWIDTNGNGVQDVGEAGKAGVTVQLYTAVNGQPGILLGTKTTDTNGNYGFSGMKAGDYNDSDANATTGKTGTYTLAAGESNQTVAAGLTAIPVNNASIGDRVWDDANGNGVQDAGETGLAGVTVKLLNSDNTVVATTSTDTNGNYTFSNLAAGSYSESFTLPTGYKSTTRNVGSADTDSNIDAVGNTGTINLSAGQVESSTDAGFIKIPTTTLTRDQATLQEDTTKTFNVLTNDIGTGLKLVGVSHETPTLDNLFTTRGGALSFTSNGQVTYKSMTDYYGNDKLVYTVEDANGNRSTQLVDVKITPVSDAPVNTHADSNTYHGSWHDANGWHTYLNLEHFGHFSDAKDQLQLFGGYNNGVANDVDTERGIVITGVSPGADLYFNGVKLNFNAGQQYLVTEGDIIAFKLILDMQSAYTNYGVQWHYQDTGVGAIGFDQTTWFNTPIALDLNGDHQIGVTGATPSYQKDADAAIGRTVHFDIDADGKKDTIEWFNGSGDGILIDNRDGQAASHMDGSRLFGDQGGKFGNGYDKLALLDSNGDGQLSGTEMKGIELWVDNGDAVVQAGEIQSLAQHGIAAINTNMTIVTDAQGKDHLQSTATRTDGSTLMSEDVFFAKGNETAAEAAPNLAQLLDGHSLDGVLGSVARAISCASNDPEVATYVNDASELLRKIAAAMHSGAEAHAMTA